MASKEDLKLFFNEAEDLIQSIEDDALSFEENPKSDKSIQNLFFAFHTLKGMTAMVGLDNLSKFCHHFENFLEKNKKYKDRVERKEDFVSILFESLDVLRRTIKQVKSGKIQDLNPEVINEISDTFKDMESEYEITFFKPMSQNELESIRHNKANIFYKIYIRIQDSCVFRKVRLFIIFRALNKIGRICSSKPEPDLLEKGFFENDFEIYFMSQKGTNEVTNVINEILEIDNKVITKISADVFYKEVARFVAKFKQEVRREITIEPEVETIPERDESVDSILDGFSDDTKQITSVKVDINTLEQLMDYFGELVIIKNQLSQFLQERQDWEGSRFFDNMDKLFLEIQEIVFTLKLVRVETTFRRYRRLVRDVSKETNKNTRFILEGMDVEIDRKVLEDLNSPLIHLLRNAIYHGIETSREREIMNKSMMGTIKLKTYRRAGSIYIEITDDGRGLDYEKIRQKAINKGLFMPEEALDLTNEDLKKMIFLPGFSTLKGVDEISGRGMGLAIVAEKIEELGGSIDIYSERAVGTTITLDVPFTRAILKAQLLKVGSDLFAIPIENIKQIYFFNRELIEYVKGIEHYRIESRLIPLIRLNDHLSFLPEIKEDEVVESNSNSKIAIWCLKDEEETVIFLVDEILQQMELVIKPFRSKFSEFQEILGVTITGDGSICLILDVLNIISAISKKTGGYQQLVEVPQ